MAGPSVQFKKLLCDYDRTSRDRILYKLSNWLMEQHPLDSRAAHCSSILQNLCNDNGYQPDMAFKNNPNWFNLANCDNCISLQRIVDANLAVPQPIQQVAIVQPVEKVPQKPRRSIPKKIRGLVWKEHFGESMTGSCFCCKKKLEALDDWHAGHIVSHANGGKDGVANLRPICISCNLSMGTENMDEFKERCYSA
jgi:5-methylcytosine-specific restriction endonuclease McrA